MSEDFFDKNNNCKVASPFLEDALFVESTQRANLIREIRILGRLRSLEGYHSNGQYVIFMNDGKMVVRAEDFPPIGSYCFISAKLAQNAISTMEDDLLWLLER